ncbi:MAG TPA: dihydrolipoamide acetyltransferase family protein [Thermodesulfobacteriota bacterium]|nr:dihydrolipoamide acetyltransferase family protein [Thermodesulfobacteriota bacterium]
MVFEFKLPDLGEGITEGEVVKWRVKEGDAIEEHQVIVEVETDKAIVEVPSPKKGKVVRKNKAEGDVVSVGETLVTLELEEKEVPEKEKRPPSVSVVGTVPEAEEVLATPLVRNLAKRLGVDLKKVTGTGPGGRITEEDVKGAGEGVRKEAKDKYGPIERVAIKGVRKSIAKNLMLAQKNAAFVTGMDDCDMTELWKLRIKEKGEAQKKGVHLTFLPFFMKASQHALREHPMLNASVDEETGDVIVKKYYNIGVAVDTPEGLMVPVVKDVDKKTIIELAGEVEELGKKARDRKITLEELKGSTFTISNFGTFGGVYATPIINYPDVAILGTGTIRERPWAVDGKIVLRVILPISFTFDHRVVDGKEAALFMNKVIKYLEDPGLLFIESL